MQKRSVARRFFLACLALSAGAVILLVGLNLLALSRQRDEESRILSRALSGPALTTALNEFRRLETSRVRRTLLLGLGVLAVIFALSQWASYRIGSALDRIQKTVLNLARGRSRPKTDASVESLAESVQDMASRVEELERIKNDIFHMAVHDIRSPLSALQSSLDILSGSPEIQREHSGILQAARSAARRLFQMTERMLLMAKMESGKFTLDVEPVDLPDILKRCLSEIQVSADVRQVRLSLKASAGARILADGHILERVVLNLLTNAVRHTPSGGEVRIGCEPRNGFVNVLVSDTGTGVAPKDKERIFEAYEGGGTGLGLAFCKMAVEKHGGKIWVEPGENGKGCRFVFLLPL